LIVAAANAKGGDWRAVVNEIQAKVKREVELPFGYFIQYGGQSILDFRF
jgi:Cu/Ag efflux pump CusA